MFYRVTKVPEDCLLIKFPFPAVRQQLNNWFSQKQTIFETQLNPLLCYYNAEIMVRFISLHAVIVDNCIYVSELIALWCNWRALLNTILCLFFVFFFIINKVYKSSINGQTNWHFYWNFCRYLLRCCLCEHCAAFLYIGPNRCLFGLEQTWGAR